MKNFKLLFLLLGFSVIALSSCKKEGTETKTAVEANTQNSHPAKSNSVKVNPVNPPAETKSTDHLNTGGLQWKTFDEVAKMKKNDGKKYLVDVYTDWCGWCKVMDKKTFTDPAIQAYLRENFHVVKFDAERKTAIPFKGQEYTWQAGGRNGINKLAVELLGARMSYPTMVYLDENLNKIRSIPGYKKPDQLMADLKVITGS